jgi:hypothetical protein
MRITLASIHSLKIKALEMSSYMAVAVMVMTDELSMYSTAALVS